MTSKINYQKASIISNQKSKNRFYSIKSEPPLDPNIFVTFGKYKRRRWKTVPSNYLYWIIGHVDDKQHVDIAVDELDQRGERIWKFCETHSPVIEWAHVDDSFLHRITNMKPLSSSIRNIALFYIRKRKKTWIQ